MIDFSTGYAKQSMPGFLKPILDIRQSDLLAAISDKSVRQLHSDFATEFFIIAKQAAAINPKAPALLNFSACRALDLIAMLCAQDQREIYMMEPCLDSARGYMQQRGISMDNIHAVPEQKFTAAALSHLSIAAGSTLFLTCPNNPTGHVLTRTEFTAIAEFAAANDLLLVCDFCFRFCAPDLENWDQYHTLRSSGVSFITIEDTGKIWPVGDKLGMSVCSEDIYPRFYRMHEDFSLTSESISLTKVELLTRAIHATRMETNGIKKLLAHIPQNYRTLQQALKSSALRICTPEHFPLAWIQTPPNLPGPNLVTALAGRGIQVNRGGDYFWHLPNHGHNFIRISLNRTPEQIHELVQILSQVLKDITPKADDSPSLSH